MSRTRGRLAGRGLIALFGVIAILVGLFTVRPHEQNAAAQSLSMDALGPFGADAMVRDLDDWTSRRAPALRAAFQNEIYGQIPDLARAHVEAVAKVEVPALRRAPVDVEEWRVELGDGPARFNMVVITPHAAKAPLPVIVMEVFCGTRNALPGRPRGVAEPLNPVMPLCNSRFADPIIHGILGRFVNGPPVAEVAAHGYALAIMYPSDVVADRADLAGPQLARIGGDPQTGALGVWAVLFSRAYDVLAADPRFDARRVAIWGHSRHGKAALLAGAFDPRFAAVIAHQSGRFGASPLASGAGEPRTRILERYGYWFTPALTTESPLSVDQHELIALNAPRPVLIGNGVDDGWSDPAGTWDALRGAQSAYALYGVRGLVHQSRETPDFSGDLVYFQRPGRHGVTTEDWRNFMAFLDAHLR